MKLSVMIRSCNLGNYLEEALESVLRQRCQFDFEIVIGEDSSDDQSADILETYQERFPDRFRVLHRKERMGPVKNFESTLQACRGEYVALLDPDDFWTCEDKLQKQVDFLDQNSDYVSCAHHVTAFNQQKAGGEQILPRKDLAEVSLEAILTNNLLPTSSLVFRREGLNLPWNFSSFREMDWLLNILNAERGRTWVFTNVWGAYRVHSRGLWSSISARQKIERILRFYEDFRNLRHPSYDAIYDPLIQKFKWILRLKLYWPLELITSRALGKALSARILEAMGALSRSRSSETSS